MKNFKSFIGKIVIIFCMALIFGILGSSNVHAANIGQKLTTPENGWQRFDDTNEKFSYSSMRKPYTNSSPFYNGTWQFLTTNETIKFNFTGTKLRIISMFQSNGCKINKITIDDSVYNFSNNTNISYKELLNYQVLAFEKLDLSDKEHFVTITNTTGGYFFFDAIDIDSNGELKPYKETSSINVSNISLNKTVDSVQVGQTDTLVATVTPDNASNKNVTWKSSDDSIATVDATGKVTGVKEGTATITATTTDGSNLSASCVVTVKPKDTTPTNPTNPTDNNGNAILTITMTNGNIKSYTVSMTKVNDFISWYDNRVSGSTGKAYYTFDKTDSLQPFTKKTEFLVFDKISSYEVDEYTK